MLSLVKIFKHIFRNSVDRNQLGHCGKNVILGFPLEMSNSHNVFLYDNTNIYGGGRILSTRAKFIMKKNSGSAQGLTAICGGHMRAVGRFFKTITDKDKDLHPEWGLDQDIVVEEDVWIGMNVTLLSGVKIGRGATIGAGSVVRNNVPPYSIVAGNPAKVVGFNFTPEEVIRHEVVLYPADERLSSELLQKNYERYFIKRIKEIQEYIK